MVIAKPLEIDEVPDLISLAEEVRAIGEPRLLRRNGEDLAVLAPVGVRSEHGPGRVKTEEDRDAFLSSAGSWRGVDVEQFLKDNAESRQILPRPAVEL